MAVKEDLIACENAWFDWIHLVKDCKRIIGCSLNDEQLKLLHTMFPNAKSHNYTISSWNLNNLPPSTADVIIACNVFHYSPNPALWFNNVLSSCRYFWMQDLYMRYRGDGSELGKDGDSARYALGYAKTVNLEHAHNLKQYGERLIDYRVYDAGSMRAGRTSINFVACFRGDLA